MQPLTDYALLTSFPNEEAVRPLPLYLPYLLTLSLSPRRYGPHYKLARSHTRLLIADDENCRAMQMPQHSLIQPSLSSDLVPVTRAQAFFLLLS
jgi:hypothetical protein